MRDHRTTPPSLLLLAVLTGILAVVTAGFRGDWSLRVLAFSAAFAALVGAAGWLLSVANARRIASADSSREMPTTTTLPTLPAPWDLACRVVAFALVLLLLERSTGGIRAGGETQSANAEPWLTADAARAIRTWSFVLILPLTLIRKQDLASLTRSDSRGRGLRCIGLSVLAYALISLAICLPFIVPPPDATQPPRPIGWTAQWTAGGAIVAAAIMILLNLVWIPLQATGVAIARWSRSRFGNASPERLG